MARATTTSPGLARTHGNWAKPEDLHIFGATTSSFGLRAHA